MGIALHWRRATTRNVWGRARFLLWLRIASTVLLGCCVIAGCLLYVALHPHGAGNSGPVGARQGRVAVLGGRRPARAPRAPARRLIVPPLTSLHAQATVHGITVRFAVVGGVFPAGLVLSIGPLPKWIGVGGASGSTMTDALGRPIAMMDSSSRGGCQNFGTYPVRCVVSWSFVPQVPGTRLILTVPRLLITTWPGRIRPYWLTGPWSLMATMPGPAARSVGTPSKAHRCASAPASCGR